jgi:hypothetical protein
MFLTSRDCEGAGFEGRYAEDAEITQRAQREAVEGRRRKWDSGRVVATARAEARGSLDGGISNRAQTASMVFAAKRPPSLIPDG